MSMRDVSDKDTSLFRLFQPASHHQLKHGVKLKRQKSVLGLLFKYRDHVPKSCFSFPPVLSIVAIPTIWLWSTWPHVPETF